MTPRGPVDGLAALVDVQRGGDFRLRLDLRAEPGTVVALRGANGSGKTTFLHAVAGLVPLSAGSVVVDGEVLDDPEQRVRLPVERRPIGVVFSDTRLFPFLDGVDNVAFGLRSRGVPKRRAEHEARALLTEAEVGHLADVRADRMSRGQQQWVAILRALAVDPRVLLLDEPFAALDAQAVARAREWLRSRVVSAGGGRAPVVVMATHDDDDVRGLGAREVVVVRGSAAPAQTQR